MMMVDDDDDHWRRRRRRKDGDRDGCWWCLWWMILGLLQVFESEKLRLSVVSPPLIEGGRVVGIAANSSLTFARRGPYSVCTGG